MNKNVISPTPIIKLNKSLNDNNLFIKRDDLFPYSFGGNKARKAMFFLKDIVQTQTNAIVTYGSSKSNHCRIIANIAAQYNYPCFIISPSENSEITSNRKLLEIYGATVINCPLEEVNFKIEITLENLRDKGFRPYFIQGGGHGNLGTEAYVEAYNEILKYEKEVGIYFDNIFLTSGTGTTQAGLICGSILNGDDRNIIGISNARKMPYGGRVVYESVKSFLESKGTYTANPERVNFVDSYVLKGYGDFNDEIINVIKETLINEGIPLDTTYTGKAFWGMKDYIKEHGIYGKNILFIHTGGTPLFFDNLEVIKNDKKS